MAVERIVHVDMSKHTRSQAEKMIRSATLAIEQQAKQLAMPDTGALRRSITHRVSGLQGEVGTSIEYGPHVEYGTQPHAINSAVYIRGVGFRYIGMHPGTRAKPFLRPALDSVAKQLRNLWGG